MKLLSRRQILMLHSMLIAQSGGMDGLRDEGLLDSAVNTPLQAFGGQELYPTILEKAARLGSFTITLSWTATNASELTPCSYFWTSTTSHFPTKMTI